MTWLNPLGPHKVGSEADHLDLTEANKERLSELGLYRPGKPLKNIAVNPSGPYQGPYTVTWKQLALANVTGGGIKGDLKRKYYLFFYAIEPGGELYNTFIAADCVDNPSKFGGPESQLHIDRFISQHENQHSSKHDHDPSKLAHSAHPRLEEHHHSLKRANSDRVKKGNPKEHHDHSRKGKNLLLEFFQPGSKTKASEGTKAKLFFGFQNTQIFFVIHPETWNPKQKRFTDLLVNGKEILQQNIVKAAYADTAKDYVVKQWNGDGKSLSGMDKAGIHAAKETGNFLVGSVMQADGKSSLGKSKAVGHAAKNLTTAALGSEDISKGYADVAKNLQKCLKGWEKTDAWKDTQWYLDNSDVVKYGGDVVDFLGLKDFAADIMKKVIPVPGFGTVVKFCYALDDRFGGQDLWYIGDGEYQNKLDTSQLKKMQEKLEVAQKAAKEEEKLYKSYKSSNETDIEEEQGRRETVQGIFTSQNIYDNLHIIQTVQGSENPNGIEKDCTVDLGDVYKGKTKIECTEIFLLYFFGAYTYGNAYPVFIHESALGLLRNREGLPKEFLKRFPADKIKDPKFWLNTIELKYINNKFSTTEDLEGIYLGETYGGVLRQSLSCGICQASGGPIIYFVIAPLVRTNNKEHCALKEDKEKGKLEENFNLTIKGKNLQRRPKKHESLYMELDLENEFFEKAFEKLKPPEVAWHKSADDRENFKKFGFKHVGKPKPKPKSTKKDQKDTEDQHNHVKFAAPWMTEQKLKLTKIAVTHKQYNGFLVANTHTTKHHKVHEKLQNKMRSMVAKKAKENDPKNELSLEQLNYFGMSAGKLHDLEKEYELMGYYDHKEWQHRC